MDTPVIQNGWPIGTWISWGLKLLAGLLVAVHIYALILSFMPVPGTVNMAGRVVQGTPVYRTWVPLEEISPHLVRAVIAAEDTQFCNHAGIDVEAIQDALAERERRGQLRGASTLTQQTAKNVFFWNGGGYARKGGEEFEPIDARASVSSALEMMEPQLKRGNIEITRTLPREPVIVLADKIRLEQVLINLLRNALDATKGVTSPEVSVVLSASSDAMISVRDNGIGIDDLDSLFEPFYTTKAPGDGVGLGLAISSGSVNDLGGRLTARNADAGGAVFEIRLPLTATAAETAAE